MGVVYPEQDVALGNVPDASGIDHLRAAHLFFDSLTAPDTPTHGNVKVMILGSVVTGHATRRSDLDYFLVREPCEGEETMRQRLHIESAVHAARTRHHVRLEGQQFTQRDVMRGGIGDPLWLKHVVDIQDSHPEWVHGQPIEPLRSYAIDLRTDLDAPEKRSVLARDTLEYFGHKINVLEEAGDFDHTQMSDLHLLQRALEAGKAYTRKGIAILALEGTFFDNADVTDRDNMQQHSEIVLDRIDGTGQLQRATEVINGLDREYDDVLDEALASGETSAYRTWLSDSYLRACAAALRLAKGYYDYIDDITWRDRSIVIGQLEYDDHSMQDSGGEPLGEGDYRAVADPALINLDVEELDVIISSDPVPVPVAGEAALQTPTETEDDVLSYA